MPAKKLPPETFWTRLEARMGTYTLSGLETAAGLSKAALFNGRKRGSVPTLDVGLAVCRVLGLQPADLYTPDQIPDLPPALGGTPGADETLRRLDLKQLVASHLNPRRTIEEDALAELAESIAAQGLLQNLVVRKDADQPALYWIVAGERRFRALTLLASTGRLPADLAAHGIPCRVLETTDQDHVILALLENMQRQNVPPLEEAEAIARLHAADPKKWTTRHIAERLGVTQRQIQLRLQLAEKLTPDAKDALRAGEITVSQAKILAARPPAEQGDLLQDALDGHSEQSLAQIASENMMEAKYALFDIAKSGLETWEGPEGELFICDFEAAMTEQEKIVTAKKAELLKAGRPWVDTLPYRQDFRYTKGGKGAVIVTDQHTGEVTIQLDLDRLPERAAPKPVSNDHKRMLDAERRRMWDAEQRYMDEHEKASAALLTEIRGQMTFTEACALLLFDALVPYEDMVINGAQQFADKTLLNIAQGSGLKDTKPGDAKRLLAGFRHLLEIKGGYRDNAITALIGERLRAPKEGAMSPVFHHLIKVMHIDIPRGDILLDTSELRKARIKAWAEEVEGQTDPEDAITEAAA